MEYHRSAITFSGVGARSILTGAIAGTKCLRITRNSHESEESGNPPLQRDVYGGPQVIESGTAVEASDRRQDTRGLNYRTDVQGLRAVAVVAVLLFHAGLPLPGGFVGVDVFFVISGFVITVMLLREWNTTQTIRFKRFYRRRFQRLMPALAVLVSTVLVVSVVLQSPFGPQQETAATGIASMFGIANLAIYTMISGYFDSGAEANPLLNIWSLSVEEQFYLFFPAFLMITFWLASRIRRRSVPLVATLALGSLSFAASIYIPFSTAIGLKALAVTQRLPPEIGTHIQDAFNAGSGFVNGHIADPFGFTFFSPVTRAWEFAAGAALAMVVTRIPTVPKLLRGPLGFVGIAALCCTFVVAPDTSRFSGFSVLVPVCATAAIIFSSSAGLNSVGRVLSRPLFLYVGLISYSLYLWHWPFIVFGRLAWPDSPIIWGVLVLVSLPVAAASARWVEMPLRQAVLRPRQLVRLVAVTIGVPVVVALVVLLGSNAKWWLTWDLVSESPEVSAATARGCTDTPFDPVACTWGSTPSAGVILLVGDSQADSFSDGVLEATKALDLGMTVSSKSGCPFLLAAPEVSPLTSCDEQAALLLDYAKKTRPEAVVIANRATGYLNPWGMGCGTSSFRCSGYSNLRDESGDMVTSTSEGVDAYARSLSRVVSRLVSLGIPVVLIQTSPHQPFNSVPPPTLFTRMFDRPYVRDPATPTSVGEESSLTNPVEQELASSSTRVSIFDPGELLCDSLECPFVKGGQELYADRFHLSPAGARLLAPQIAEVIKSAIAPVKLVPSRP